MNGIFIRRTPISVKTTRFFALLCVRMMWDFNGLQIAIHLATVKAENRKLPFIYVEKLISRHQQLKKLDASFRPIDNDFKITIQCTAAFFHRYVLVL